MGERRWALNQVQPSQADWTGPQEGSFGDTIRKAPRGHWREARGPTHFPALAKVRHIIESLFWAFVPLPALRRVGEGRWMERGASRRSPLVLVKGRGWSRTCHSLGYSHRSLGKEQRKNDKDTDMLGTCGGKCTHAALARGSR